MSDFEKGIGNADLRYNPITESARGSMRVVMSKNRGKEQRRGIEAAMSIEAVVPRVTSTAEMLKRHQKIAITAHHESNR